MSLDLHVLSVVETLLEFLDRAPAGILLLDEQRHIVYTNGHAAALHARSDGISLTGGILALARTQDDTRLRELMARTAAVKGSAATMMRVSRSSGKRPYAIFVARLPGRQMLASRQRPAICMVITDPETRRTVPIDRLQDVFDLTEAEGRLAALLAAGEDLKSAAVTLGVTYGTARARLAEIFRKTDTCRQGELITLLLTTLAVV